MKVVFTKFLGFSHFSHIYKSSHYTFFEFFYLQTVFKMWSYESSFKVLMRFLKVVRVFQKQVSNSIQWRISKIFQIVKKFRHFKSQVNQMDSYFLENVPDVLEIYRIWRFLNSYLYFTNILVQKVLLKVKKSKKKCNYNDIFV